MRKARQEFLEATTQNVGLDQRRMSLTSTSSSEETSMPETPKAACEARVMAVDGHSALDAIDDLLLSHAEGATKTKHVHGDLEADESLRVLEM